MNLEIGQKIEVEAFELDRFGQGVCRYQDMVVFVYGLLQGEKALVTVTKLKKTYVIAEIKKLLIPSKIRKTVASKLGALDLYHVQDKEQSIHQKQVTQDTLNRALGYDVLVSDTLSGEQTLNYRNKVVYHVFNDSLMRLGLFQKEPIELIEVHTFILNSLSIQRTISKIQQQSIEVDPLIFKHIVLRSNEQGQVLVTLVAYEKEFKGLTELVQVIKNFKEVVGITLNIKPNEKQILGTTSYLLHGKNELSFKLNHTQLKINDQSFLQVNQEMMLKTYDLIATYVEGKKLIDCYSGVGSIGLYLRHKVKEIIMIENNPENIVMAKENAKLNPGKYQILEGDAKKMIKHVDGDILVIDPPRNGLDPQFIDTIINKRIPQVIYLSCELNTLQRDLKILSPHYEIKEVTPIRMFPQTTSMETLVLLTRKI